MYHSKTALAAGLTGITSGLMLLAFAGVEVAMQILHMPAWETVPEDLELTMITGRLVLFGFGFAFSWLGFGTRWRWSLLIAAIAYAFAATMYLLEWVEMFACLIPGVLCFIASTAWLEDKPADWLGFHGLISDHIDDKGQPITPRY